MAELTIGAYRLRFLTIEKETHVLSFLTGNGLGNVVTVESGIQPDKQTWFVLPVNGKEDKYIITQDPNSRPPAGLTRDENSKVILSNQPTEWGLEHVPPNVAYGNENVYKIRPPPAQPYRYDQILGKDGQEAVIHLLFPGPPGTPVPVWQFERV